MEHETLCIVKNIGRPAASSTAKGGKQSQRLEANRLNDCLRNYTKKSFIYFKHLSGVNDKIDKIYFNL